MFKQLKEESLAAFASAREYWKIVQDRIEACFYGRGCFGTVPREKGAYELQWTNNDTKA
jgi:hypothetical protein